MNKYEQSRVLLLYQFHSIGEQMFRKTKSGDVL